MSPDELWEKYKQPGKFDGFTGDIVCGLDFLAALREYGAAVRKRDAEICREVDERGPVCDDPVVFEAIHESGEEGCAAAIEREPLP